AAAPDLTTEGGRVRRPGSAPTFPPAIQEALDGIRDRLAESPFAAPEQPELEALGLRPAVLAAASRAGLLLRLPGEVVLLPESADAALTLLTGLPQPFTTSQARQALATTRRVAVPLLEHLDAQGRTRRVDSSARIVVR
ncbi:MAG: SelB C-terminal domain-containing protein, partial [Actinomycetota bacterium]|nr:SelB C-terminal domain-containing protein [Actinomycetota bacterium]